MPLLVLDIYKTIIPELDFSTDPPTAVIPSELLKVLSAFHDAGWNIVTADGSHSSVTASLKKELKRLRLSHIISAYHPEGYHAEDTKSDMLHKYKKQYKIANKDDVYFYDDGDIFISHARENGFKNAFVISTQDTLINALTDLAKKENSEETSQAKKTPKPKKMGKTTAEQKNVEIKKTGPVFNTRYLKKTPHQISSSLMKSSPDEIIQGLFICRIQYGDQSLQELAASAKKPPLLNKAILRCTNFSVYPSIQNNILKRIPAENLHILKMEDADTDLKQHFQTTFDFIDNALNKNMPVYVHCDLSAERSPSIVAAYLMKKNGLSAAEACNHVRNIRPSAEFTKYAEQLNQYEKELKPPVIPASIEMSTTDTAHENVFQPLWRRIISAISIFLGGLFRKAYDWITQKTNKSFTDAAQHKFEDSSTIVINHGFGSLPSVQTFSQEAIYVPEQIKKEEITRTASYSPSQQHKM